MNVHRCIRPYSNHDWLKSNTEGNIVGELRHYHGEQRDVPLHPKGSRAAQLTFKCGPCFTPGHLNRTSTLRKRRPRPRLQMLKRVQRKEKPPEPDGVSAIAWTNY